MRDRVADVLAQRAKLDRGPGVGVALSLLLHIALGAFAVYATLHASPPTPATMVNIQFAQLPAVEQRAEARRSTPKIEEPKPKIEEPKPEPQKPAPKPEKNTVPLSPFGRSTKRGSETPALTPPPQTTSNQPPATGTVEVPLGGSGITGIEGGDFPYTLYIQGMHRKIGTNWFRPQITGAPTTVVYFRILRDGTITDAKVETPSGNGTFDRAALSAVRSASPLNPLPFAYSGNYLGVHLTFR